MTSERLADLRWSCGCADGQAAHPPVDTCTSQQRRSDRRPCATRPLPAIPRPTSGRCRGRRPRGGLALVRSGDARPGLLGRRARPASRSVGARPASVPHPCRHRAPRTTPVPGPGTPRTGPRVALTPGRRGPPRPAWGPMPRGRHHGTVTLARRLTQRLAPCPETVVACAGATVPGQRRCPRVVSLATA
jgi:hypothetical protein